MVSSTFVGEVPPTPEVRFDPVGEQEGMATIIMEVFDDWNAVKVANCESGLKHYDELGKVLRGKIDPDDTGIFQINKRYHLAKSIELGLDLDEPEDNIKYAKWLYDQEGWGPWKPSGHCWKS